MRVDTRITFEVVKVKGLWKGECSSCGKAVRRQRTFEATINPCNKNKDGSSKSKTEVAADLAKERDKWLAETRTCVVCDARKACEVEG